MAKYEITHACGHTETVELFGKGTQREYIISRKEKELCPACAAIAAQEKAKDAGLPALTGSNKQISWATSIRAEYVSKFDALRARSVEAGEDCAQADELHAKVIAQTSASWWIDRRGTSTLNLLREAGGLKQSVTVN
ncbi:MAG: hypothetical protein LBT88_02515 [Oscillospiraceae bacterium]|jgi:hypothetical protein|nr:hypothetical protein [Oscillospiraceae bacterium]